MPVRAREPRLLFFVANGEQLTAGNCARKTKIDSLSNVSERKGADVELVWECLCCFRDELLLRGQDVREKFSHASRHSTLRRETSTSQNSELGSRTD